MVHRLSHRAYTTPSRAAKIQVYLAVANGIIFIMLLTWIESFRAFFENGTPKNIGLKFLFALILTIVGVMIVAYCMMKES